VLLPRVHVVGVVAPVFPAYPVEGEKTIVHVPLFIKEKNKGKEREIKERERKERERKERERKERERKERERKRKKRKIEKEKVVLLPHVPVVGIERRGRGGRKRGDTCRSSSSRRFGEGW
jgi:hypothetical protein